MSQTPSPPAPVRASTLPPRQPGPLGPRTEDAGLDIHEYLTLLLERRWVLLVVLCLGVAAATLWSLSQPKVYEARASIIVEANVPQVLGAEVQSVFDPTPGNFYMLQDYLQTSRRVITSDSLARRAAARLKLLTEPDFYAGRPPARTIEEAGELLLSHYTADHVSETRIMLVTAKHGRPEWAKKIADAIADEFVKGNQQQRDTSTQTASQQLADELDVLRKGLHDAEVALYEFKAQHDMLSVNLEDKANQVARQIDKYADALTEIRLKKRARQSQLEELQKLKELDPLHVPTQASKEEGGSRSLITELRRVWVEEDRRFAELRARYQDSHPQVQQQAAKVGAVLRELKREVDNEGQAAQIQYNEMVRQEGKVNADLDGLKQEGLRLTRLEIEYNKLKRDADSLQKQYNLVLNRTKETGMVGRLKLNNVHVLDYARLPQSPVSPRLRVTLLAAVLLSLILGLLLAFLLDAMDRSIKTQDDVESKLLLPFLGMLPRVAGEGSPGDMYVAQHPRSTVAEACRTIRTNVMFAGAERELKIILVTSSVAREGKTLSCVSLGTVLAQGGARVLLIDCDLRRPRIAKAVGIRAPLGLTNVLLGEVKPEEAIVKTDVENLHVLCSGPIPPNPSELLDGGHFRRLLQQLAQGYDRLVIDSPPAVPVTDPAILATAVDGVVLVVRHRSTSREAVKRAAKHIQDVGGRIVGVVLNDIDTSHKGYRSYYGSYYNYYQSEYLPEEEERPGKKPGKGRKDRPVPVPAKG